MRALKIRIFQETVCYKKPMAFKTTETYPLPPYSTVIGMLHKIIKADKYIPMNVSIQGKYESLMNSYNTMMFYKSDSITKMPLNINMLYGVDLIIHIYSDDSILEKICDNVKKSDECFILGRGEDMARIDCIEFVELQKKNMEDYDVGISLKNNFYVPLQYNTDLDGIRYNLNKVYNVSGNIRRWSKIQVNYVEEKVNMENGIFYLDTQDDLAFFA